MLLLASLSEPAYYLRGSAVLLYIKSMKNRDFLSDRFSTCAVWLFINWRHSQCFDDLFYNFGNKQFGFFNVTINNLTICCQIPVMSNLAISLRDVTIDAYLTPHVRTYLTPHVYLLAVKRWVCVCFFFIASMLLNSRGSPSLESQRQKKHGTSILKSSAGIAQALGLSWNVKPQAPAKRSQHFNATHRNIFLAQHVAIVWPPCFNMLRHVACC